MPLVQTVWNACVAHHGHECPGIALGFKAVEAAVTELGLDLAQGSEKLGASLACTSTTARCPVDAVRALLGCTEAAGNLTLAPAEPLAFTFAHAPSGRILRLTAKPGVLEGRPRAEALAYVLAAPYADFYQVE